MARPAHTNEQQFYALPTYNPNDYYKSQGESLNSWGAARSSQVEPVLRDNLRTPDNRISWAPSQHQNFPPPPPPGPPPSALARMHSVVREIAVPPKQQNIHGGALSSHEGLPSFRQPARSQAPLPLRSRELAIVLPKTSGLPPPPKGEDRPVPTIAKQVLTRKLAKPAPIDVQLAETIGASHEQRPAKSAPLRGRGLVLAPLSAIGAARKVPAASQNALKYPKTAGLTQSWTIQPDPESLARGLPLSPLDTQLTPCSTHSILVDFTLSPSLVPLVSQTLSPNSQGPSTQTSSPSIWSPQTPRAMSFDNVVVLNDTTPPMPTIEWLNERRGTIIEEEMQDETPLEADPPRGRIAGQDHQAIAGRARSMSPPTSAYPKESAFSWDLSDINRRYATDDDLYCLTPIIVPQMIEDVNYKPVNAGFDVRQTILGSYFGR